ncbi:MAG TPA: metallophosphoesterase [Holophagaceae bacterium]|nr:metallophosphoesterase [Holophagaceae bacterium]
MLALSMVAFLAIALLVVLLQWAFHHEMKPLLPWSLARHLGLVQAVLHLPMLFYMALRLSERGAPLLLHLLRPWSRLTLYLQAAALCFVVWNLLVKLVWHLRHWRGFSGEVDPARRSFLRKAATLGAGAAMASGSLGAREAYSDPLVTRLRVAFPDLPPGLDGLRIVHLCDFHSGPLMGLPQLRRWRELAEREKPELLLYGGDFVDSRVSEMAPFVQAFGDFHAPLGAFGLLGNHDYFDDPVALWATMDAIGIRPLENAHAVLERGGDRLALVGLQDSMALNGRFRRVRFGPGPLVPSAVAGLGPEPFRLGLIHSPNQWSLSMEAGARLTLAGHTHGGQVNLIPGVSSARVLGPYTAGLYEQDGRKLYVSRGLGVVGLPLRVACPAEILVVTLVRG